MLAAEGRFEEGYILARDPNPVAAICGYVCSAPCEKACRRGRHRQAARDPRHEALPGRLALRQQHAGQRGGRAAQRQERRRHRRGAGRADGRQGAGQLRPRGATSTRRCRRAAAPRSSASRPSGCRAMSSSSTSTGSPSTGCEFHYNVEIGRDVTIDQLQERHDAVVVSTGCMYPVAMNVPGEEIDGVIYGVDFLKRANLGEEQWVGEHVVVVGGGYTAMDSSRTALRLGAKTVDHRLPPRPRRDGRRRGGAARDPLRGRRVRILRLTHSRSSQATDGKVSRDHLPAHPPGRAGRHRPAHAPSRSPAASSRSRATWSSRAPARRPTTTSWANTAPS